MTDYEAVKDSGERQEWETGSRRDTRKGKGRYDLIPPYFMRRLARHFENGAKKYGDHNWEKGQPLSRYLDSALRHTYAVVEGKTDEDHPAAAAWNMAAFMCTAEWITQGVLPAELDDLGYTGKPDPIIVADALHHFPFSDDLSADWDRFLKEDGAVKEAPVAAEMAQPEVDVTIVAVEDIEPRMAVGADPLEGTITVNIDPDYSWGADAQRQLTRECFPRHRHSW